PLGRPKPDLRAWLDRYDIEQRLRAEQDRRERARLFDSPLLEGLVRPLLDDLALLFHAALRRLGVGASAALERKLAQLTPQFGVLEWYAIRVGAGISFLAVGP